MVYASTSMGLLTILWHCPESVIISCFIHHFNGFASPQEVVQCTGYLLSQFFYGLPHNLMNVDENFTK